MKRGIEGHKRVRIEDVTPQIDTGRYPVKRIVKDEITVKANIFADGHDRITAVLRWKPKKARKWNETSMKELFDHRWTGKFVLNKLGIYEFNIIAWIDHFGSWRHRFVKKLETKLDVELEIGEGLKIVEKYVNDSKEEHSNKISRIFNDIQSTSDQLEAAEMLLDAELEKLMQIASSREHSTELDRTLKVAVDPHYAQYSSWYELFPRSASDQPGWHGTFKDVENRLEHISEMGFDTVYFPPIHPIAEALRKGPNNSLTAGPDDPGSPWAIGSKDGGHKSVHPQLGTFGDFRHLLDKAKDLDIRIAIDIAFQTSPEHPFVNTRPEWYRKRTDGSIQYAENPPKKYQDIYPFDFDTPKWKELWKELKNTFEFWIDQGVYVFRVDNPHTKPFAFWEWCISEIKRNHPEVIFLSEAFTSQKVMFHLSKIGFNQSYTYFPWKNYKHELTGFIKQFTSKLEVEYFRSNHWTNTPDILNQYLQEGGRPAFMIRLILAATLGANYGVYGPAFELCRNTPVVEGSEEYLDSEKYQICHWNLNEPQSIKELITQVNIIRKSNIALHSDRHIVFHKCDNDNIICYSKHSPDFRNVILTVVNLDPHNTHEGMVEFGLDQFYLDNDYTVNDLLTENSYTWHPGQNYVKLDPSIMPAHIFRVGK